MQTALDCVISTAPPQRQGMEWHEKNDTANNTSHVVDEKVNHCVQDELLSSVYADKVSSDSQLFLIVLSVGKKGV